MIKTATNAKRSSDAITPPLAIQDPERMSKMDMVIEVLDARFPLSSVNPLVAQLRGAKNVLKNLNKSRFSWITL